MTKVYKGLMILGLLMIGFGVYFIAVAMASKSWDQVEGTIINTRIPATLSNTGSATQRHLVYRIEITYAYDVDGKTYENSRFSLGTGNTVEGGFNEKSEARKWLKTFDYSSGKKVTVFVKSGEPETTVISSGINIGTIMPILLGLLFFFLGFLLHKFIPPVVKPE